MDNNERQGKFLVETRQVFGDVSEMRTVAANPIYTGGANQTGALNEIRNQGADHGPSFADQGAGAQAYAARGLSDPFWPTGRV